MDDAQFDEFYSTSGPILVNQLYAMIGDAAEAQDCVQEAFIKAWTRRGTLDIDGGNPHAWVRTTAYRLSVSRWRRATGLLRAYQRYGATPSVAPPNAEHADVQAALADLPMTQRHVMVLHYLCDLSVEDIARETGQQVGTVKSRLHRARAALATQLSTASQPEERNPAVAITLPPQAHERTPQPALPA